MAFTQLEPSSINTLAAFSFASIETTGPTNLGPIGNVIITGGSIGQVMQTDGAGNLSWATVSGSSGGTATTIAGANVVGTVASATIAASANAVAGANVSGQVGNALVAGTVYTNAQPNITSVGTLSALTVTGTTNLGAITNVKITGGLTNQVLTTDGLGNLAWAAGGGGGSSGGGAGFITISKDIFTATGTANTYTLSITPSSAAYIVVNIDGIVQQLSSYTLSGNVVTISGMPSSGEVIEITAYGAGGLPGGSNSHVQYNDNGVFQGAPAFTFNSATSTLSATNITGNLTTSSQTNITSVGNLASLNVTGTATFASSQDVTITSTPSGTVNYDLYNGMVFDVTPTANWTANVGNIAVTNNRTTVVTFIITQGATPYVPNVFQISGVTQIVKWLGGTAPTGTASKVDVISFSMIRSNAGVWTVLGQSAIYG